MQLKTIPVNDQEDVIAVYWQMLRRMEENARDSNSQLDKLEVEGWYRLWNRMTGDSKVPHWMQQ